LAREVRTAAGGDETDAMVGIVAGAEEEAGAEEILRGMAGLQEIV
jgi:hypothetical protein